MLQKNEERTASFYEFQSMFRLNGTNADAYDRTCYNRNLNSTPYLMPNQEELLGQEIFALADVSRTVLSPLSQVHYRHGHHWS